ncbi:MAG: 16S rRNA (uracil(1498)-N(3))-methyltransferase, partial [Desulfobacterales bacterium]|nr:16S rRNA (uracil(1498)-N(3))-methyltransferase [Desulfobacterales bacterium]
MQIRRFKIDTRAIVKSACVIKGLDANHIVNVLRLKAGARVVLFDGAGQEYEAIIAEILHGEVRLSIELRRQCQVESHVCITVAQGFLKDKKMDTLIRQLTELGISRWIPFFGARSIPHPDANRLARRMERWQKIADEALKQCLRALSPRIEIGADFSEMLRLADTAAVKLIFWEAEEAAFPEADHVAGTDPREVFIALGPEGGFTAEEIDLARQAGFQPVSLGPRILRAETATIAAGTL